MQDFYFISIPKVASNSIKAVLGNGLAYNHASARKYENEEGYKFAFVRNPYDRVVSWYQHHRHREPHLPQYRVSFKAWVISGCPHHWSPGDLEHRQVTHPLNQYEYIYNQAGEKIVNFVGRYENLQADFNTVCLQLGVEPKQLPSILASPRNAWQYYLNSDYIRGKVYEQFKNDFNLFNYAK